MIVADILEMVERKIPFGFAESWDNSGLLIGDPKEKVRGILLCLDITPEALQACIRKKCNVIIAHHPLIFSPLKHIRENTLKGKLIAELIRRNISVIAIHTNLDSSPLGMNAWIAEQLGLADRVPLRPYRDLYKLVTFVPLSHEKKLREQLADAGAGTIGNYTSCSFNVNGYGTFRGGEGTHPAIGTPGIIEEVKEVRMEMICEGARIRRLTRALKKAHPYEEPAYEFYAVRADHKDAGLGIAGKLKRPLRVETIARKLKEILGIKHLRISRNRPSSLKRIGICTGSGSDLVGDAAGLGCELFITGDVSYHTWLETDICLMDAGHFGTEHIFPRVMKPLFEDASDISVQVFENTAPYTEK